MNENKGVIGGKRDNILRKLHKKIKDLKSRREEKKKKEKEKKRILLKVFLIFFALFSKFFKGSEKKEEKEDTRPKEKGKESIRNSQPTDNTKIREEKKKTSRPNGAREYGEKSKEKDSTHQWDLPNNQDIETVKIKTDAISLIERAKDTIDKLGNTANPKDIEEIQELIDNLKNSLTKNKIEEIKTLSKSLESRLKLVKPLSQNYPIEYQNIDQPPITFPFPTIRKSYLNEKENTSSIDRSTIENQLFEDNCIKSPVNKIPAEDKSIKDKKVPSKLNINTNKLTSIFEGNKKKSNKFSLTKNKIFLVKPSKLKKANSVATQTLSAIKASNSTSEIKEKAKLAIQTLILTKLIQKLIIPVSKKEKEDTLKVEEEFKRCMDNNNRIELLLSQSLSNIKNIRQFLINNYYNNLADKELFELMGELDEIEIEILGSLNQRKQVSNTKKKI